MEQIQRDANPIDEIWDCLHEKNLKKLQYVFFNNRNIPPIAPNMLLPLSQRSTVNLWWMDSATGHAYTILNWACYYKFEEGVAFLMWESGDPYLEFPDNYSGHRESLSLYISPIKTAFHACSDLRYSVENGDLLALLNIRDNHVAQIGRDPHAKIENYDEGTAKSSFRVCY